MPITTPSFVYPTSAELMTLDQDFLPVLSQSNPIFGEFPLRTHDASVLVWERRDDYLGLMQGRGQEGEYPVIPDTPLGRLEFTPGRYGEHALISGKEIEDRRGFGTFATPINITDLVVERQEKTATRQFNQMAYILWTMLTTGRYIVLGPNGAVIQRDSVQFQSFTSTVPWSTAATATPIADMRAVQLLQRGHSVTFDSSSTMWMTTQTKNYFLGNLNAADLFGRRNVGLSTIEGIGQYNKLIATEDNLPMIKEYDAGYKDDAGTFHTFIPDGTVILIGRRNNGATLGEFALTRNADNGNSSTPLVKVIEKGLKENEAPPAKVGVYRGFNGGPIFHYPNSIVVMTVNF